MSWNYNETRAMADRLSQVHYNIIMGTDKRPRNGAFCLYQDEWDFICGEYVQQVRQAEIGEGIPPEYRTSRIDNFVSPTDEHKKILAAVLESVNKRLSIWTGPSRRGKTHLLYALWREYIKKNFLLLRWKKVQGLFASHSTRDGYDEKTPADHIATWVRMNDVIQLDDFNFSDGPDMAKNIKDYFFELVNAVYERQKTLIVVSNNGIDDFKKSLGYYLDKIESRMVGGKGQWICFDELELYK